MRGIQSLPCNGSQSQRSCWRCEHLGTFLKLSEGGSGLGSGVGADRERDANIGSLSVQWDNHDGESLRFNVVG